MKKKVEVFKVRIKTADGSELKLEEILLNKEINAKSIKTGFKHVEFVFVEEKDDFILGIVQSTKMNATPPKNNLRTRQMSSLGLSNEEGLGYGNVFLYSKSTQFFLYEVTKDGVFAGQLASHIYNIVKDTEIVKFDIHFEVVMNVDAMKKLLTMGSKKLVHMQFANPDELLKKVKNEQQSIKEIAKSGNEFGAEFIDVTYKIVTRKGNYLHTNKVNQLLEWVNGHYGLLKENVKKLSVKGYEEDVEGITEVDLIKDKMIEYISYSESKNMVDLKPFERKQGIIEAYLRVERDIKKIISNEDNR